MRVDLLTREYPPFVYGGAGVHVGQLTQHLRNLVDLRVHCYGESHTEAGVVTHQVTESLVDANSALKAMAVNLSMSDAVRGTSVVHSHTWYANFAGHLAKVLHDVPHVATAHSLEPMRPWKAEQLSGGYRLSSFMEETAFVGADRIIAVSQAMADDIVQTYPRVDPGRVSVVHNGIDADEFAPDHETTYLEEFGISPDRPVIACVARITRQKGLGHLLRAAEHFTRDAQLVIVAQASDTPEQRRRFGLEVARLRGSGRQVTWIGGDFPRQALRQLMTLARVFVCPSIYEPMGIVNLEAMACGTAVVATATGGIPEVVVQGETGLLVPLEAGSDGNGEPEVPEVFAKEIAARVNHLIDDPATARRLGSAGRERVVARFSWPSVAEQVRRVYEAVA
ncbi:glycosyl transferase family 1 [Streptomyces yokosukanensis]|uniref:Glycosyl transferase family 1 n=1 Tax=Streptomyces yokosukanensis TaxID=67386 RepID=A0A101NW56_9ACTN|nr:glycogen synthase [Streptomyces yokosukanensis]KUN00450.1 glycosyl transferase family 1 [Streptomyces yokosukanensis]